MTQTHTQCKQVEPQPLRPRTRRMLWGGFIFALIAVVVMQLVVTPPPGYFEYDETIWFYPLFGLTSSVALVLVSKLLSFALKRRENYWEDEA